MEETIEKSRIKNPERFSTSPCWIGLGRIEDADVEKQQELKLPSSSMVKNPLRFRYQENIRKDQGFREGGLIDVNSMPPALEEMEEEATMVASNVASPSSAVTSSLWRDLSGHHMSGSGGGDGERNGDGDLSMMKKKLRLSKDQSAYLEAVFKNNNTLNPKLKLDLAKKLNLRTRQVEVWFQNRRARTKLKQTEVECDYLRRWCERLTEDNRRLQKELKALKASHIFLPMHFSTSAAATTLSICSSCATTTTAIDSSPSTVSTTAEDGDCTTTVHKRCQGFYQWLCQQ